MHFHFTLVIPVIPVTPVILVTYELARGVVSFVAGAHFQPYMSVPTGPTWGGAGPVSRVSRDSLILTLYHGRDRSAGGRTRSVWPACRATMRVIGWSPADHGCPSACWLGGYTHVRLEMSAGYKGKLLVTGVYLHRHIGLLLLLYSRRPAVP